VDEVLRLARSTRDVTLVYANDEASEVQEAQIPEALNVRVFLLVPRPALSMGQGAANARGALL
jgi:hypothetical protein